MSRGRHRKRSVLRATAVTTAGAMGASTLLAGVTGSAAPAAATQTTELPAHAGSIQATSFLPMARAHVLQPIRAVIPARAAAVREITVEAGNTLFGLAQHLFGSGTLWPRFYAANASVVGQDPDLIRTGQVLQARLAPRGAYGTAFGGSAPVVVAAKVIKRGDGDEDSDDGATGVGASAPRSNIGAAAVAPTGGSSVSGTLSCSGLEQLWEQAGGSPGLATTMASIAMAESGGSQYATGPYGEEGYWQINPHAWADATYNPIGNARDAVAIAAGGGGLDNWTTYMTGAYAGRC